MTRRAGQTVSLARPLPEPGDVHVWHGRPAPVRVTRDALAPYLGNATDRLAFVAGRFGKPELVGRPLRFSKSTTRTRTVVAVTRTMAVGVDIERVRPIADVLGLATKAFGADAAIALGALPRDRRDRAFLQAWTRLEAVIKADGGSLGQDMARYRIVWSPDAEPAVLSVDGDRNAGARYTIHDLTIAPDIVGAVAVLGNLARVHTFSRRPAETAQAA